MKVPSLKEWESKGEYTTIDNNRLWYIDLNQHQEKVICILHGYPTCSFDYYKIFNHLKDYRVVIHDHIGFGLSDKSKTYSYHLKDQANMALGLYQYLGLKSINIIAHDYGTSVATEIMALDNSDLLTVKIEKIILSNGSMLIDMSQLRPIQKMLKNKLIGPLVARLASFNTFYRNMKNIWYDKSLVDKEEMKLLWSLLLAKNGRTVLSKVTRYIDQRFECYDRWIGALSETNKPVLILWGKHDPVAIFDMVQVLEAKIKNSSVQILENAGHYPMIEQANQYAKCVREFI